MANESTTDKLWTPSNIITLTRICLVPVFVVALVGPWPEFLGLENFDAFKPWVAAAIFIVISCTDWLDGYLARKRNEVTDFGKFMDPLADKILVIAALLVLIELRALPSWVVLIIVAREFIVSGVRMVAASKGEVIAASWYGKAKTVFTMVAIVLFVLKESPIIANMDDVSWGWYVLAWLVMAVALVLTIVSMLDYIVKARHLLGFKKKDGGEASAQASQPTAAERVIARAVEANLTVGTAESCTGGLVAAALTDVPGASAVVRGGIVSYVNDIKRACLGVSDQTLDEVGPVSEQTACQMASGACRQLGADVAVSVTGIAGPGGAEPGKPVGTVWIGVASARGSRAHLHRFDGGRDQVRAQAVAAALALMESEIAEISQA